MKTAAANGTTLAYSDVGRGLPLLCLHGGIGIDGQSLRVPGILDLAGHGVRVLIPDQRGHGASGRSDPAEYSHATWAADAHALAEALGLDAIALLGHSYGGFLALEYAVRWPESLSHLVLVATSAGPVRANATTMPSDAAVRESFRSAWPRFFVGDDKHWSLFEQLQFAAEPYNAAFTRELPAYDLRERMAGLAVRTLLVVGADDPYRPHMEWLAEHMPDAQLAVFEGVGHLPFVEAAGDFTRRVAAFLRAGAASSAEGR